MKNTSSSNGDDAVDPLIERANEIFERTSPYPGDALRNHCKRLYYFATSLMDRAQVDLPRNVAYVIAMVHDLGLVSERDAGHNYLQRSRALFHRETRDLDLGAADGHVIDQCLLYNHRLLPVPNLSLAADCFRRAVIIEHTRGLHSYGIGRAAVRQLFEHYPRLDLDWVLLDFTRRVVRAEPLTLVNGIFF